ncbi:putative Cytochrome c [Nitrospira japonica]|uniref:Putative Cytochrome c n=1 Tax=Nitrospira japonica TaxID=1325564 RepID=A0A1W1I4I6_9BACT|nr:c-type cytochrome [Nitrospira japonica]SLM47851.1 putative Cytochrome c [Nitrospira japonica]
MKKRVIRVVIVVCLVALGMVGWVGYQLFTTGFSAKTEPHRLEVLMARQIRHLAVPIAQRNAPNPVPLTPAVLKDARAHFADHCAICHANDGSGRTPIGKNVYPKAPDLREADTQSMSDGELFWAIHNGIRFTAMPAWGDDEPEKDMDSWKLVHFIRHLPNLTPEELDEMKGLNPKTRHEMEEEAEYDKFLEGDDTVGQADGHHH